jgi:hypothetical protein
LYRIYLDISRDEVSRIQKSAWVELPVFLEKLRAHKGEDIKLRWGRGRNYRVKLIDVGESTVSFERLSNIETVQIEQIDGFTSRDEWFNLRKSK